MQNVVSIREVTKEYRLGKVVVPGVKAINLEVESGEFFSVAGPSGSGKTTLLNLIGCIDIATSGTVLVDGQDVAKLSDRKLTQLRLNTIGFVFQSFNLVQVLSAFRNVELPLLLQGKLGKKERTERVLHIIDQVGLSGFLQHRPGELSGGQRQRVAIARALVTQPKVVLADEPTANLDSKTGERIITLMKELNSREGTTFIFSTHDPRIVAHATRVVQLSDGSVVADLKAPIEEQSGMKSTLVQSTPIDSVANYD